MTQEDIEKVTTDKDNWPSLVVALNRFKNKTLYMKEIKKQKTKNNPIQCAPNVKRLG